MPRTKKEHIISTDEKQAADLQIKEMQKQIDYDTKDFMQKAIQTSNKLIIIFSTGDKDFLVLDIEIPEILTMAGFLEKY